MESMESKSSIRFRSSSSSSSNMLLLRRKPSLDSIEKVLSQSPGKTFRKMMVDTTSPLASSRKRSNNNNNNNKKLRISSLSPKSRSKRRGLVMLEEDMKNLAVDVDASSPEPKRDRSLSVEGQRIEDMLLSIVATPKHKTKTKTMMSPLVELKEEEISPPKKRKSPPPPLKKRTPPPTPQREVITPPISPPIHYQQQQQQHPMSPGIMVHPMSPLMAPPMSPMMWYGQPSPRPRPHVYSYHQQPPPQHHHHHHHHPHPRYHHPHPSQNRYTPPPSPGVVMMENNGNRAPTLSDVAGQVWKLSNGQRGCRLLQQLLSSDSSAMEVLLRELRPHLIHLMKAPFGNYLFQKMVETANPSQLRQIVSCVSPYIAQVSSHVNGTRSAQKIIMTCKNRQEISAIVNGLEGHIPGLSVSSQGTHVVMRCLESFPREYRSRIVDCVLGGFDVVVRNSHGCRIIQICFDLATREEKTRMVDLIVKAASVLSKHERANYAVQHVLKNGSKEYVEAVARAFRGSYVVLAKQKFASNVVEVCLRVVCFETKMQIVGELIDGVKYLVFDQFANYVVQNALSVCREKEREKFVAAIKPYARRMREDPSGKRILQKIETSWGVTFD